MDLDALLSHSLLWTWRKGEIVTQAFLSQSTQSSTAQLYCEYPVFPFRFMNHDRGYIRETGEPNSE